MFSQWTQSIQSPKSRGLFRVESTYMQLKLTPVGRGMHTSPVSTCWLMVYRQCHRQKCPNVLWTIRSQTGKNPRRVKFKVNHESWRKQMWRWTMTGLKVVSTHLYHTWGMKLSTADLLNSAGVFDFHLMQLHSGGQKIEVGSRQHA